MTADRHALLEEVAATAATSLSSSDAVRMRELLEELVRDWYREAGTDDDAPAVLDLLRREFDASIAGTSAAARIDVVRAAVINRRIRHLGVRTLELGRQIIDGEVSRDDARARGESLMQEIEAVAVDVRTLADEDTRAQLSVALQEASMEALYAIEGKTMSLRLNYYARNA